MVGLSSILPYRDNRSTVAITFCEYNRAISGIHSIVPSVIHVSTLLAVVCPGYFLILYGKRAQALCGKFSFFAA